MKRIEWIEPYYDLVLNEIPKNAKTILDVGSGSGVFGFILKKTRNAYVTAIEPHSYDLNHYDNVISDVWQNVCITKNDVLVSLEMIEHMSRYDALQFLHKAKQTGKKVIIVTPYKWQQQPPYDNNEYQVHKSLITIDDFKNNGYTVRLIGSFSFKGGAIRFIVHSKLKQLITLFGGNITNMMGVYEQK